MGKIITGQCYAYINIRPTSRLRSADVPFPRFPASQEVCWSHSKTTANLPRFPTKWSLETAATEKQKGAMKQNTITSVKAGLGSNICIKNWEGDTEELGSLLDYIPPRHLEKQHGPCSASPPDSSSPPMRCGQRRTTSWPQKRRSSPRQTWRDCGQERKRRS